MVYFWCSGESRKDAMMVLASFTKLPARWAKVLLCALALVAVATAASAGKIKVVPPEGADWQRHAETYLSAYKENRRFSLQLDKPGRCVKANNYGCMWQPTTNWEGTPGPDGTNGAHDGEGINNGHAILSPQMVDHRRDALVRAPHRRRQGAQERAAIGREIFAMVRHPGIGRDKSR